MKYWRTAADFFRYISIENDWSNWYTMYQGYMTRSILTWYFIFPASWELQMMHEICYKICQKVILTLIMCWQLWQGSHQNMYEMVIASFQMKIIIVFTFAINSIFPWPLNISRFSWISSRVGTLSEAMSCSECLLRDYGSLHYFFSQWLRQQFQVKPCCAITECGKDISADFTNLITSHFLHQYITMTHKVPLNNNTRLSIRLASQFLLIAIWSEAIQFCP